jgi:hypothetical protein
VVNEGSVEAVGDEEAGFAVVEFEGGFDGPEGHFGPLDPAPSTEEGGTPDTAYNALNFFWIDFTHAACVAQDADRFDFTTDEIGDGDGMIYTLGGVVAGILFDGFHRDVIDGLGGIDENWGYSGRGLLRSLRLSERRDREAGKRDEWECSAKVRAGMHCAFRRGMLLFVLPILASTGAWPQAQEGTHRISFKFDYDFRETPACSKKVETKCVRQFVLYDLSAGVEKKTKLGTVAVPEHAKGVVKGISATTEPLLFNSGKHLIGVAAEMADGTESDPRKCTTAVRIP